MLTNGFELFPSDFEVILTNLQEIGICIYGDNLINMKFLVTLELAKTPLFLTQILYKWHSHCFRGLSKRPSKISKTLWLVHLVPKMQISTFW